MVDYLITPASGTAAISDSSGVSTTPGANKLWASGASLYWNTGSVSDGSNATVIGSGADNCISTWTSSGITGTSDFTWDENNLLIQSSSSDKPQITIKTTHTSNAAPTFNFVHESATPANSDDLAYIYFKGYDTGDNTHTYANIAAESTTITEGSEEGSIRFRTTAAGTDYTETLTMRGGKVGIGTTCTCRFIRCSGKDSWR